MQEEIEPEAVLEALGVSGASVEERVTGGEDAALWRVVWNGKPYALRVLRPEQAGAAVREAEVMRAAAIATEAAVPKVVATGQWQQRPALLMDWCEGRTLLAKILEHSDLQTACRAYGHLFGAALAKVHRVPVPDSLRGLCDDWQGGVAVPPNLVTLERTAGPETMATLLHLDFHPQNVLTDGIRITGIIDWVMASVGPPEADLARSAALVLLPRLPADHPVRPHHRRAFVRAFQVGYAAETGRPLPDLASYYAWAGAFTLADQEHALRRGRLVSEQHLHRLRRWTAFWERRCLAKSQCP